MQVYMNGGQNNFVIGLYAVNAQSLEMEFI